MTLHLHEDGLILCNDGLLRVILSAKAVWAAAKDSKVVEKVRTASIIVRKSRVDMEICCGGGVDVLGPSGAVGAGGTGGAGD